MASETIRDIIQRCDDLHYISIKKPTRDKESWTFTVNDPSSRLDGVTGRLVDYRHKIVTLQRGCHYFVSFKIFFDDGTFEYMVDPKKAIHRSSTKKYLDNLLNYVIWSNDISRMKSDPSFKYTKSQMYKDGVTTYLDMCFKYCDYSSVGTGLTRDVRNIIVLDIDVNCEKPDNKRELENMIVMFSHYDFTPNFYIFNRESKHVQLQWLIQDCEYKEIIWDNIRKRTEYLDDTKDIDKELNMYDFSFTELTQDGIKFRKFSRGLTCLSDKYKFGDKNFTFWKAKNFYTALMGKYNLELRMPKVIDGEITYLSQDEMENLFSTKESRDRYYLESPTMDEVYMKTEDLMGKYLTTISESSIKKIQDDLNELFDEPFDLYDFRDESNFDMSRNNFVFNTTRTITWDSMRQLNYNDKSDFYGLSQRNQKAFRSKVKKMVKSKFDEEDNRYGGEWPGTTNRSRYTASEFNNTFSHSFEFAIENYVNLTYSDDDRNKSLEERRLKKNLRHVLIIYLMSIHGKGGKMKNKDLLVSVNDVMRESGHEEISNSTLKRDLNEIRGYSVEEKQELIVSVFGVINDRMNELEDTQNNSKDKKEINVCRKRLKRLSLCNIEEMKGDWDMS